MHSGAEKRLNGTTLASRVNLDRINLALEPSANSQSLEHSANVGANVGEIVGRIVGEMRRRLVSLFGDSRDLALSENFGFTSARMGNLAQNGSLG